MLRFSPEQMQAFREGMRAQLPQRVLEGLHRQGVKAEQDARTGELVCTDARGQHTRMAFSPDGLPARLTPPSGQALSFEHDAQGRLAALLYPDGERLELERDARGNVTAFRRPGLPPHSLEYDEKDRLLAVVYPDGSRTRFDYHPSGPLARVTDGAGAVTRYERNESGRLRTVVDPLGRETRYETDEAGALAALVFADGSRQEFGFDPETKTTTTVLRDGGRVVHRREEAEGLHTLCWADGTRSDFTLAGEELKVARNAWGAIECTHDAMGRLLVEDSPHGRVRYAYDEEGRLVRLVTPWGDTLEYEYDVDGRPCRVRDWQGRENRVCYGPRGTVSEVRYGNGLVETQTHARAGRLGHARVVDGLGRTVGEQLYTYDVRERLSSVEDRWSVRAEQRQAHTFHYDAESRLLEEAISGLPPRRYAYDVKGNLVADGEVPVRVGLLDEPRAYGGEAVEYDGNGNMVRLPGLREELRCSWGGDGLLREVTAGSRTVRLEYDALGRRVLKTDGGSSVGPVGFPRRTVVHGGRRRAGGTG